MTISVLWEGYFPNRTLEAKLHRLIKGSFPTVATVVVSRQEHSPSTGQGGGVLGVQVCSGADPPSSPCMACCPLALQVRKQGAEKGSPLGRQLLPLGWDPGTHRHLAHPGRGYLQPSPPALRGQAEWVGPCSTPAPPKCMTQKKGACDPEGTLHSDPQLPDAKCQVFPIQPSWGPSLRLLLSWGL